MNPLPDVNDLLRRRVVIDAGGSMLYIGRLVRFDASGYWLTEADVHDRSDGHSPKEVYINESREMDKTGVRRVNRRRVFVERHAVFSISALEDVVTDDATDEDPLTWLGGAEPADDQP